MKIRNTISRAVFNHELNEGKELLEKYPHLKLEEATSVEQNALKSPQEPTTEDKILGRVANEEENIETTPENDETTPENDETVLDENIVSESCEQVSSTRAENKILGRVNKKTGN